MTIKEVYKENTVVHCKTEDEAERILRLADAEGWKWITKESYIYNNPWRYSKSDTCYNLLEGTYCNITYFTDHGYDIISSVEIEGDVHISPPNSPYDKLRHDIAIIAMKSLLSADDGVRFSEIIKGEYAENLVKSSFVIADEFLKQENK